MNAVEWEAALKGCLKNRGYSGTIAANLKVSSVGSLLDKKVLIVSEKVCFHCKHAETRGVRVAFHRLENLTVFEAAVLFSVFAEGTVPIDYCKYHRCEAGKAFIENIKGVEAIQ